jgi:hypothetical protein
MLRVKGRHRGSSLGLSKSKGFCGSLGKKIILDMSH